MADTGIPTLAPSGEFSSTSRVELSFTSNTGGLFGGTKVLVGADQGPSPSSFTARTSTSYRLPRVKPEMTYSKSPPPASVHASSIRVQLASSLSGESLSM